jgi:hypothetical protein
MTINLSLIYQFFPALDKSCIRDNIIVRRDWQKLRHTRLAPGQLYGSPGGEYQDSYRMLRRVTLTETYRRAVMVN